MLSQTAKVAASMVRKKVYVIGVGMTKFEKPGRRDNFDYPDMAHESVSKALKDANIDYSKIQQAAVGYCYGDSTCGQRALYPLGMTGIPIFNVNNNCATGSSALYLANQFISGGMSECVLALGFEKMQRGSLATQYDDRTNPIDRHIETMLEKYEFTAGPPAAQMFGNAGREHMEKYGTKLEHFAKIAEKNHRHSVDNPLSQFRDEYTLDQIMSSPKVHEPLTKLQCCPTSDGSAAAILASEDFVHQHGLEGRAVELLGMEMSTDFPSSFEEKSCIKMVGFDMTRSAVDRLYNRTGFRPTDVNVVELHDCFSTNELINYEALGLCPIGKAGEMVDAGDNTYGGKYVVNPSGGLISKGHPLGATGLAQCTELCTQLRGEAGKRQVENATVGLQHNLGLGGAAVVALYRMGFPGAPRTHKPAEDDSNSQFVASLSSAPAAAPAAGLQSNTIFEGISSALAKDASIGEKLGGVFCFKIKKPDGQTASWIVDAKQGKVESEGSAKPDVTLTMKDEDFVQLFSGQLNPQKAFFSGKLKIQGNMGLAMKLQELQKMAGPMLKAKL